VIFLAGLSSKLVHEIIQIVFAINETYFVGDGSNLNFIANFKIVPRDFSARISAILYPRPPDPASSQYAHLTALIDEVISLVNNGERKPAAS
jgi:hypothetical protein